MNHMVSIALIFTSRSCSADLQLPIDFFRPCSSAKTGAEYAGTVGNLLVQKGPIFLISILISFFLLYLISLPLANSVIVIGMPMINRQLTIQPLYLREFRRNAGAVLVQAADGIFVVSAQGLQMKVAKTCAGLQGSQLIYSLNQISFQIEIDQLHTVTQGINIRDTVLREVHDPQSRMILQRRNAIDIILAEIEHHKVCALRQRLNTGNALSWQRDSEDDLRRKFIGKRFEYRNIDFPRKIVLFLAQLRKIPEFFNVDITDIGSKQLRADVVVLYLGLTLLGHRYKQILWTQWNITLMTI